MALDRNRMSKDEPQTPLHAGVRGMRKEPDRQGTGVEDEPSPDVVAPSH